MALIQLFTESAHEGLMSYRTTAFDIASAITDESCSISAMTPEGFPHGEDTYYFYSIDLTATGVRDHMDSYPESPERSQFPIGPYSTTGYTPGGSGSEWAIAHNGSLTPPTPKPRDYDLHWRDKYWEHRLVNNTHSYYTTAPSTWDSSLTIYTPPEKQAWTFWTGNDNFFGMCHYYEGTYIYGVGEYQGEVIKIFQTADGSDMFPRVNGINGTPIIDPLTGRHIEVSTSWSPPLSEYDSTMGAFFIDCEYNGEPCAGIVAVLYASDGTVQRASGFICSASFFAMDYNRYYAPPEATPEFGFGAHALPGRNVNQGPERYVYGNTYDLGLSGAGSAPGSIGLKLVCSTMPVLNAYLGQYISDVIDSAPAGGLFTDVSQVLGNINSSVIDVFKVPFATAASGTALNQFQIGGTAYDGGPVYYQFPQQEVIDCGAITLPEEEGSYLDYAPYTKISIYIPFCGEFDLPTNSIMGGSIELYYLCDRLTGGCIAYVFSYDRNGREKLLGVFNGNMKLSVPLSTSAANLQPLGNALGSLVKTSMAVAGASKFTQFLPDSAQHIYQPISGGKLNREIGNLVYNNQGMSLDVINQGISRATELQGAIPWINAAAAAESAAVGAGIGAALSTFTAMPEASKLNAAPTQLETIVGSIGSNSGWAGPAIPFIRIVKTVCKEPTLYLKNTGKPSNVSAQVSDIEAGKIIQLDNFCLDGLSGTQKEKEAIYKILTTGFYK